MTDPMFYVLLIAPFALIYFTLKALYVISYKIVPNNDVLSAGFRKGVLIFLTVLLLGVIFIGGFTGVIWIILAFAPYLLVLAGLFIAWKIINHFAPNSPKIILMIATVGLGGLIGFFLSVNFIGSF